MSLPNLTKSAKTFQTPPTKLLKEFTIKHSQEKNPSLKMLIQVINFWIFKKQNFALQKLKQNDRN